MSLTSESAVIKTILSGVLIALVPTAMTNGVPNVYDPAPEMPSGVYEGTYPYVTLTWTDYSLTEYAAAIRRTDDGTPNLYTITLVDELVSESGSTLAATEAFNKAFIDAVNDAWNIFKNQKLVDANGVGQADGAGMTITWKRNPAGADAIQAGVPTIVCIGTLDTLSLPYSRRNS